MAADEDIPQGPLPEGLERARVTRVWDRLKAQGALAQRPSSSLAIDVVTLPPADSKGVGPAMLPAGALDVLQLDGPRADFTRQELLGRGGMGEVHLAVERTLRREVALKSVPSGAAASVGDALLQEALYTGYLEHPNVIPVHRLGTDAAGRPVMAMKRVAGTSWADLVDDPEHSGWETLSSDRQRAHLEILIPVCNAVNFAHSRGIIHRDVKPANVMVGEFGEVYLLDWGLAIRLEDRSEEPTPVVGYLAYMAPEMLETTSEVTCQTDVFLLGATLHHALTGRPRHSGSAHYNVMLQVLRSKPFDYGPEVPRELAEVCNRATAADPADRYASALELRRALERYLEHRGSYELTEGAHLELAALEREYKTPSDATGREAASLFAACRFGYEQALHVWPENPEARDGLQRCLVSAIERELSLRNAGLVETLLPTLPTPRPDLEERFQILRNALAAEAEAEARLEALERENDLGEGGRQRTLIMAVSAALCYSALFGVADHLDWGERALSHEVAVAFGVATGAVLLAGLFAGWRWLMATHINQRLVGMVGVTWLACMLHVVMCWVYDYPSWILLTYVGLLMTVLLMNMTILIDRRLWAPATFGMGSMFTGAIVPGFDPLVAHIVIGSGVFLWISVLWWRDPPWRPRSERDDPPATPPSSPGSPQGRSSR